MKEELFFLGQVVGCHGIKGELKISFNLKREHVWASVDKVKFLHNQDPLHQESTPFFEVQSYRFHKNYSLLKLKNLDNINDVEQFIGCQLYVHSSKDTFLLPDEFLTEDLAGLIIKGQSGEEIGVVIDSTSSQAAGDSLIVKNTLGQIRYIPFVTFLVPEVNLKEQYIVIHDIPGLMFDEV